MLYSIIQIGPEIVNNTTNVLSSSPSTSIDYGLLQSIVVLLAGSLLFLGLGIKFNFIIFKSQQNTDEFKRHIKFDPLANVVLMILFFVTISIAVGFSLYEDYIERAKTMFIISIIFLAAFLVKGIIKPDRTFRTHS